MICHYCGVDTDAKVTDTHSFLYPFPLVMNGNTMLRAKYSQPYLYKRARNTYAAALRMFRIPEATGKRRVKFTREWTPPTRQWDRDNYIMAMKPFIDGMVDVKMLIDDRARFFEGYYQQMRSTEKRNAIHVEIEDINGK